VSEVAKAAQDTRQTQACSRCALGQNARVSEDICEQCFTPSLPIVDFGLGDVLKDWLPGFRPVLITEMHTKPVLTEFVRNHINRWCDTEITVDMTCGGKTMPRISVQVYEFLSRGDELLVQIQYFGEGKLVKKRSPALGMKHIDYKEMERYDKYISEIVDNYLDDFGVLCWKEDNNDFLPKLFKLMTRVKPENDDEVHPLPYHHEACH
jgi:hypothetical protein